MTRQMLAVLSVAVFLQWPVQTAVAVALAVTVCAQLPVFRWPPIVMSWGVPDD